MAEATQPGASEQQQAADEYVNPRDAIMESIEEKIQKERDDQIQEYNAQLREEEMAERPPDPPPPAAADGAATRDPMHEPPPPEAPAALPDHLASDPLAEYIVIHNDVPMFRAKIDGQDMLIPLDRARTQIQKHEAAEVRLQGAAEMQRQLTVREETIRQNEAALQARIEQATQAPPPAAVAGVDDETAIAEAKEIVSQLFTADEETAAEKLATFLVNRTRTPAAASAAAPPVDQAAIAKQAAQSAVQQISASNRQGDIVKGYETFKHDYPEIMADANLYTMADSMTDAIGKEHPDWLPSQIMLESGKRTRAWVDQMKGKTTPEPQIPLENRQQRKEDLVPIPQPAASSQQQSYAEGEEAPQTPQDVIAEYRTSRGQPT